MVVACIFVYVSVGRESYMCRRPIFCKWCGVKWEDLSAQPLCVCRFEKCRNCGLLRREHIEIFGDSENMLCPTGVFKKEVYEAVTETHEHDRVSSNQKRTDP